MKLWQFYRSCNCRISKVLLNGGKGTSADQKPPFPCRAPVWTWLSLENTGERGRSTTNRSASNGGLGSHTTGQCTPRFTPSFIPRIVQARDAENLGFERTTGNWSDEPTATRLCTVATRLASGHRRQLVRSKPPQPDRHVASSIASCGDRVRLTIVLATPQARGVVLPVRHRQRAR